MVDDFRKGGGEFALDKEKAADFSDAEGSISGNTITVYAPQIKSLNHAADVILFELLRYKYRGERAILDKQALAGATTKEKYATECEKLTYKYVKEHHRIVNSPTPLPKELDSYEDSLKDWDTFEKFLEYSKEVGHYQTNEEYYDQLRNK